MQARQLLVANDPAIHDANFIYEKLLSSAPLLFAKYARELLAAGVLAEWKQSTDSSARVLAYACEAVLGEPASLELFMKEFRYADKSTFEHYDRLAYLTDALMLTPLNNNVDRNDKSPQKEKFDKFGAECEKALGEYAEHFWRDMPEPFFLHVTSHLTQPYRIQRLSRWVNAIWPEKTKRDERDFGLSRSSNFYSGCQNAMLKILLNNDLQYFDRESLADILATEGAKIPGFKKLSAEHQQQALLSLSWTAAVDTKAKKSEFPDHYPVPIYKNFSRMRCDRKDLSQLDLSGGNFQGAHLNLTKFVGCHLTATNFSNSSYMCGMAADDIPPGGADFSDANLTGAIFQGSRMESLKFTNSILRDMDCRQTSVQPDSEIYTMHLAEAADTTGISFADSEFAFSDLFLGFDASTINVSGCQVQFGYWDMEIRTLEKLFELENLSAYFDDLLEKHSGSIYMVVSLYLGSKIYHEDAHAIFTRIMSAQETPEAKRLLQHLETMKNAEVLRLFAFHEAANATIKTNQLDLSALLNMRLVDKNMLAKVRSQLASHPMLLLDYCLQFASTSKLNEVAEFCQKLNLLDGWAESNNAYARLFASLMKDRLGQPIEFASMLDAEVSAITAARDFNFTGFHRLAYLVETFCSDLGNLPIPEPIAALFEKIPLPALLDEIIHNLKNPVKLFRLGELLPDRFIKLMGELALPAMVEINPTEELIAPALIALLFTHVYWVGHLALEDYLKTISDYLKERYGKELRDILYTSLWATRQCPRGSLSSHEDDYYKNLIGLQTHVDYIFHHHNTGANLRNAILVGGLTDRGYNETFAHAWLKNAKLTVGHDKRRSFKTCDFTDANLCGAVINRVLMDDANLTQADLRHTEWKASSAKRVIVSKANCHEISFHALEVSDFTGANSATAQLSPETRAEIIKHRSTRIAMACQTIAALPSLNDVADVVFASLTPWQSDERLTPGSAFPSYCHTDEQGFPTNTIDIALLHALAERYLAFNSYHEVIHNNLLPHLVAHSADDKTQLLVSRMDAMQPRVEVVDAAAPQAQQQNSPLSAAVSKVSNAIGSFFRKKSDNAAEPVEKSAKFENHL